MKRNIKIVGLLLVLMMAGSACHNIRHDRRDMKDTGRMIRIRMGQVFSHNRRMPNMQGMIGNGMRSWMMRGRGVGMNYGMMRGMGPQMGFGMMRGMGPMGFGMMRGMNRMPMDSTGWQPMGQGRRMLESIPNVTESQKKQIEDLNKKQFDDMKKLREEMYAKMQSLMDSHRKDILNILTDEQKKFIESRQGNTPVSTEKGK